MARIRIILHGKAAGNAGLRVAVYTLREDGHVVEVRVTWEPGDAARLTAEAVAEAGRGKIDCIVAGGGDGTINEVFAAAYEAGLLGGCSLGVLPLGTANDFAHSTGVPTKDLTAALRIAASAPRRWIDVGLVNGRLFVNLVSGGFGSRVTVETDPKLKQRLGGLAYAITGIDLTGLFWTKRCEKMRLVQKSPVRSVRVNAKFLAGERVESRGLIRE